MPPKELALHFLKKIRMGRHLLRRITGNRTLRLCITLIFSLVFHAVYALFQFATGLYYRGRWFYALAFYDILLTAMRIFLLHALTRDRNNDHLTKEWRCYRFCGLALLLMMPTLIAIVGLIVFAERPLVYHGITTLAVALYTLCSFTVAIFSIFRHRQWGSPLLSAAKAVSLTTASVSFLSLEISLLFTFGSAEDLFYRRIITGVSGTGTCIFVLLLALHMIRRANLSLRAC